jgi:signal transduction histidine kinase/ActR/RegA family two-component response regulator
MLLERLPIPVAIIDDHHVLWANPAMQTLLGYSDHVALVGLSLATLILPGPNAQEERWVRADGTAINVEVTRTELAEGTLVVAREMLRSEGVAAQVLADRLAPAGTLAAGIAHQINNPLAYVLANLSFLEDELPKLIDNIRSGALNGVEIESEKQEMIHALDDARHGAERVASIVRDLKLLSHLDDESVEDVDPRETLDSAYNVVQAQVQARARVIKDYRDVPRILANEARLVQVFVDLLLNAAQSIPDGHDRADVTLSTSTDPGGWACITVTDTGCGVAPEVLPKIFDPFFTTKPVGEGTGLGLTICHGIVSSLGGRIHVDSTVGSGTTVRVLIPPTDYTRRVARSTLPVEPLVDHHLRILIVDDEVNLVQALRRNLENEHHVVATTLPGDALDRLLAGEWFDVVLCDVVMPQLSGIDLYERVRAERPDQAERFVFMTGGAFTARMRARLEEVDNEQLDKPFSHARLKEVLDAVHPRDPSSGKH